MENYTRAAELAKGHDIVRILEMTKDLKDAHLVLNLSKIDEAYTELERSMPNARIFFAMKACPVDAVLGLVVSRGGNLDVASRPEIEQALRLGIPGSKMSYGNTIKHSEDIAFAYANDIRLFTTDAIADVRKLAMHAPGSRVNFRIILDGEGADWPLSRKFGAHLDMVEHLAVLARDHGLIPYGVSFHVGSQQRFIGQWDIALTLVRALFDALKKQDIELKCVNVGGGFPAQYLRPTQSTAYYGNAVMGYIQKHFGDMQDLDIIVEPGRSLTADAGIVAAKVVLFSQKRIDGNEWWLFLNTGRFHGLAETEGESIKYPLYFPGHDVDPEHLLEAIIAGHTCDSADILYQKHLYSVPPGLKEDDPVLFFGTGAYTMSYSSVGFNGFPPLQLILI